MFVLGCGAALIAGWLFRFSFDTRPILSLILAATVGIGAFALDVVTDVLGEVHQEAIRPRMAAGMDMPPHPRAGRHGRGHRFAAYQRSWAG